MENYKGIEYLRNKLNQLKQRVSLRYDYYTMKHKISQKGITIPPEIRQKYESTLGWCSKAVDNLADRLSFKEFGDDVFEINEIFKMNNPDVFFDSAILSALIASCCFVYISQGDDEIPRLQVIEGDQATGIIDPITNLLTEGYAILNKDDNGNAILEAYFIPGRTDYYVDGKFANRTFERADITAEFYSFPQKYVVGLSNDAEPMDSWKATISSMLQFTKDEQGDSPKLGQFTTPSMSPFTEQLRTAAAGFAGETGLTLDDLGFVSDNPSSSEAIKASHETLRMYARKAQKTFGSGFLNVGYLACCLRDDFAYRRNHFYNLKPKWQPVFEPDAATLSNIGDGAIKINQAIPGFFDSKTLSDLTGIEGANNE